jgi:hypothetical protein
MFTFEHTLTACSKVACFFRGGTGILEVPIAETSDQSDNNCSNSFVGERNKIL